MHQENAPKKGGGALIDPARIAFDIDGVVADTMGVFLAMAREDHGFADLKKEHITSYMLEDCLPMARETIDEIVGRLLDMSHPQPLLPQQGARRVLCRMAWGGNPPLFITARPGKSLITQWVNGLLAGCPDGVEVVATGSFEAKAGVLLEKGRTHFVEDRLETCFHLAEAGIEPIVFRQPWNRNPHPFLEVGSWKELAGCIRGM